MTTRPSQQSFSPKIAFISVDFPAPFGPMIVTISPGSTWRSTPWTISASPYPVTSSDTSRTVMCSNVFVVA